MKKVVFLVVCTALLIASNGHGFISNNCRERFLCDKDSNILLSGGPLLPDHRSSGILQYVFDKSGRGDWRVIIPARDCETIGFDRIDEPTSCAYSDGKIIIAGSQGIILYDMHQRVYFSIITGVKSDLFISLNSELIISQENAKVIVINLKQKTKKIVDELLDATQKDIIRVEHKGCA